MDNPTRWNITNSAQNIVSALVDPSKQFDHVFRREWSNTFSGFSRHKTSIRCKQDVELKARLSDYVNKLEDRKQIKIFEAQGEAKLKEYDNPSKERQDKIVVPEVFLIEDFDLSNIEIFTKVISSANIDKKIFLLNKNENTKDGAQLPGMFTKSQLKELQQNFTDYLDIIEEKLASQISNRSGDFFQVMSSVDSVMDELSLAIKSVTSLRRKCSTLNNALILPNMKNIHLSKTRNNAQIVLDKMEEIAYLCKVQPMIQLLLSSSDFVGALDLIAKSRIILHKELTRVVCLKHLESQLVEIERVIGTMMQQEFVTLITSEWNRPLSQGTDFASPSPIQDHNEDHSATNEASNFGIIDTRLFEHERILCIVQGMIRINKLNFGEYFQQEARIAISTCVKQTLIELLSEDDDYLTTKESEISHDVYKKVQLISNKKWINLIRIVLNNLLCILKRVKVVYSVICSSFDEVYQHLSQAIVKKNFQLSNCGASHSLSFNNITSRHTPSMLSNGLSGASNIITQQSENFISNFEALDTDAKRTTIASIKTGKDGLKASLLTVCSFAEQLALNLIEYRIKESNFDKLLATEFINLSKLVENFANVFFELCERNSSTLLSLLQTQAEKFVNKFHEERKKNIESNLSIEQWKTVEDVPHDFQRLVSMLADENISIKETFSMDNNHQHSDIRSSSRQHSRASSDAAASAIENEGSHQQQRQLINGSKQVSIIGKMKAGNLVSIQPRQNQKFNSGRLSYVTAGDSTYVIVNSVINLIRIVMDYCKCAHDTKSLSAELLERLFEILQLYNSKTYNLVYNAGAMQVAGLKIITTRSLVVSQRSLKLIILLMPAIYKHFSQLLPDDNRLRRFDEIKRSYEDHAAMIPERVNSMVKAVIDLNLKEWEAKPPVPSPQFTAVAQHLMFLHDNIQDALPSAELRLLFLKINDTFKDVLIKHLLRLNIKNDAGPQQWLVTQELTFYKISSAKLSVFKGWELNYDDLWSKLNSCESDSNNSKPQQQHHHQ